MVTSTPVVERDDFHRFARTVPAAGDLPLLSYHPLGTCRMGRDPDRSVVDLDHEAHDLPGLFVVDGSTVGGPLGVNPQLTIMALATRASPTGSRREGFAGCLLRSACAGTSRARDRRRP